MEKSPGSGRGQNTRPASPSPEDVPEDLTKDSWGAVPAELMPVQICVYYAANGTI